MKVLYVTYEGHFMFSGQSPVNEPRHASLRCKVFCRFWNTAPNSSLPSPYLVTEHSEQVIQSGPIGYLTRITSSTMILRQDTRQTAHPASSLALKNAVTLSHFPGKWLTFLHAITSSPAFYNKISSHTTLTGFRSLSADGTLLAGRFFHFVVNWSRLHTLVSQISPFSSPTKKQSIEDCGLKYRQFSRQSKLIDLLASWK